MRRALQSIRGIRISTRRFLARPSGVALVSIGRPRPCRRSATRSGLRNALLEQFGDRLGALDREMTVRREPHTLDRHVVGVADDFDEAGLLIEQRAMRAAAGLKPSRTVALPDSNSARSHSRMTITLPLCADGDALVG